jgi:hypothetical protein
MFVYQKIANRKKKILSTKISNIEFSDNRKTDLFQLLLSLIDA